MAFHAREWQLRMGWWRLLKQEGFIFHAVVGLLKIEIFCAFVFVI
jgi:hypothetical protein